MLYLNLLHNKSFTKLIDWTKYVLLHSVNPSLILFVLRFATKFSDCIKKTNFQINWENYQNLSWNGTPISLRESPFEYTFISPGYFRHISRNISCSRNSTILPAIFLKKPPKLHRSITPIRTTINLLDSIFRGQYLNYVAGEGTFSNQNFKWPERMLNNNMKTSSGT